jgi:hypothetical protein
MASNSRKGIASSSPDVSAAQGLVQHRNAYNGCTSRRYVNSNNYYLGSFSGSKSAWASICRSSFYAPGGSRKKCVGIVDAVQIDGARGGSG